VGVRIHVLSDLHLEQAPFEFPDADADVVVLAGDTGTGTRGIDWARQWADGRPVLYLAGNHEFYGHALPGLIDELRDASDGSSVRMLEDDELVLDGIRFLGCTLWSDFDFDGPEHRELSMALCRRVVNDYSHIRFGAGARRLDPQDTRALHLSSRRWLAERLSQPHDGPTVVLTHHQPLIRAKPRSRELRAIAGAFVSDVTDLMGDDKVALWIYGHTHRTADLEVAGTRVLSNPRGYPHEPVAEFDPDCVVEVG
jgi:predicted phosphodiesterase